MSELRIHSYVICQEEVELNSFTSLGQNKRLAVFGKHDFIGENVLLGNSCHMNSARSIELVQVMALPGDILHTLVVYIS